MLAKRLAEPPKGTIQKQKPSPEELAELNSVIAPTTASTQQLTSLKKKLPQKSKKRRGLSEDSSFFASPSPPGSFRTQQQKTENKRDKSEAQPKSYKEFFDEISKQGDPEEEASQCSEFFPSEKDSHSDSEVEESLPDIKKLQLKLLNKKKAKAQEFKETEEIDYCFDKRKDGKVDQNGFQFVLDLKEIKELEREQKVLDPKILKKTVIPKIQETVKKQEHMLEFKLYSIYEDVPQPKRKPNSHKLGYFDKEVYFGGTSIGYIKQDPLKVPESRFRLHQGIQHMNGQRKQAAEMEVARKKTQRQIRESSRQQEIKEEKGKQATVLNLRKRKRHEMAEDT